MEPTDLVEQAKEVLQRNDRGQYTVPAVGLYPHQWLWDSCFIAIGQRHYDVERAQQEILSLLRGQWANGMLPNIILSKDYGHRQDREFWRSYVSPFAPDGVATSGITQPPMLAEAVVQIGKKLSKPERRSWYRRVYQALLQYHQWLYIERDPHGEGLTLQIHPWETGLDNTPPWMEELHQHLLPMWVRLLQATKLDTAFTFLRKDIRFAPPGQRMTNVDVFALYSIQRRLRRKAYDINRILNHSLFNIEDLTFNCILIRANHHLRHIAKTIGEEIPDDLNDRMHKTSHALEQLWDAYSGQYYSRNFATHKLMKIPTIATFLPLYAGTISEERAKLLVELLKSKGFNPKFPVPSVPTDNEWFKSHMYWQGPTWLNVNWLIIDGLKRYGYKEEAEHIAQQSLKLVEKSGFYEYFSPLDGTPAGVNHFSWTAAIVIDLSDQSKK